MTAGKRPVHKFRPAANGRMAALMRGDITVDDLTEEELLTGILNDKNGERSKKPSNLLPREFHTAAVRRVIDIVEGRFRSATVEAAEQIIEIALGDPEVLRESQRNPDGSVYTEEKRFDPVVLKAAQYVVERVVGKTPEIVAATVTVRQPWEEDLEAFAKEFVAAPGMARSAPETPGIETSGGTASNGAGS